MADDSTEACQSPETAIYLPAGVLRDDSHTAFHAIFYKDGINTLQAAITPTSESIIRGLLDGRDMTKPLEAQIEGLNLWTAVFQGEMQKLMESVKDLRARMEKVEPKPAGGRANRRNRGAAPERLRGSARIKQG